MTYSFHDEIYDLDAGVRASLPGSFIELPSGVTHYELAGPKDGRPVILIHGFSVPYSLWDHTFPALAEAGFRVLRYDLLGRGYSDRPRLIYDGDLFDRQLDELISALGFAAPLDLVGSSMGGVITAVYADRHPERVRKLVFIDPAGLLDGFSFPKSLLRFRGLGEWLMDGWGSRLLVSGNQDDFYRPQAFPEYIENFKPQLQYRGYKQAILSTMRSGFLANQGEVFQRVGARGAPALILWGREDQVIPFPISQRVRAALPAARFIPIEQAGHVPHYECPEIVNPLLVDFLRDVPAADSPSAR